MFIGRPSVFVEFSLSCRQDNRQIRSSLFHYQKLMATRVPLIAFLMLFAISAAGQFTYRIDAGVPVSVNGKTLSLAWTGGLNSPQFSTMDLDGDGAEDLVVFERMANKFVTFVNRSGKYIHEPLFETQFPPEADQWVLL